MAEKSFFSKITVFVTEDAQPKMVQQLRSLPFASCEFIECNQSVPISVYHQGDVLSGARLQHFFEYANSLAGQAK